jgi:hypothetical protein
MLAVVQTIDSSSMGGSNERVRLWKVKIAELLNCMVKFLCEVFPRRAPCVVFVRLSLLP